MINNENEGSSLSLKIEELIEYFKNDEDVKNLTLLNEFLDNSNQYKTLRDNYLNEKKKLKYVTSEEEKLEVLKQCNYHFNELQEYGPYLLYNQFKQRVEYKLKKIDNLFKEIRENG